MRRFGLVRSGFLLLSLTAGAVSAHAQAGSLDTTFGKKGIVSTNFGTNSSSGAANNVLSPVVAALQPNGDIVVAATIGGGFGVARCLPSGSLDTTFGKGGFITTFLGAYAATVGAVTLEANGDIVVAGTVSSEAGVKEFAVARFTSAGVLDKTFGKSGVVTTQFSMQPQGATAVLVQPNGAIIVGGNTNNGGGYDGVTQITALARYTSTGTLDTTFGTGGTVVSTNGSGVSEIALNASGDIFIRNVGSIAEYSSSGVEDSVVTPSTITSDSESFYSNGRHLSSNAVEIKKDDIDAQVVRCTATGAIDSTFDNPPFDFTAAGSMSDDQGSAFLQPSGQIVVAGSHWAFGSAITYFGLARLTSNGTLDSTFGSDGTVVTTLPVNGAAAEIAPTQSNGRIIAIGVTFNNTTGVSNLALARYLSE